MLFSFADGFTVGQLIFLFGGSGSEVGGGGPEFESGNSRVRRIV
jgi:hypothetical protein